MGPRLVCGFTHSRLRPEHAFIFRLPFTPVFFTLDGLSYRIKPVINLGHFQSIITAEALLHAAPYPFILPPK